MNKAKRQELKQILIEIKRAKEAKSFAGYYKRTDFAKRLSRSYWDYSWDYYPEEKTKQNNKPPHSRKLIELSS